MGMYDYIWCDYPISDDPNTCSVPAIEYQTKSLACQLRTFTITSRGELRNIDGLVPFTGTVHFYGSDDNGWHKYDAVFIDGRIQSIADARDFWSRY